MAQGRTRSNGQVVLTWLGRLFLVAAPLFVFAAVYYPKPIQVLNPLVCEDGQEITVQGHDPDWPFDNRAACESDTRLVESTDRVVAVAGISLLVAAGCYTLRSKITPKALSAPRAPAHG